jgi:hypothetical protein
VAGRVRDLRELTGAQSTKDDYAKALSIQCDHEQLDATSDYELLDATSDPELPDLDT